MGGRARPRKRGGSFDGERDQEREGAVLIIMTDEQDV